MRHFQKEFTTQKLKTWKQYRSIAKFAYIIDLYYGSVSKWMTSSRSSKNPGDIFLIMRRQCTRDSECVQFHGFNCVNERPIFLRTSTLKEQDSLTGLQHKHYSVGSANKFLLHGEAQFFGPVQGSDIINHQHIWSSYFLLQNDTLALRVKAAP